MRIGIVGLGVVGSAIMAGLQQIGHEVSFYDIKFSNTSIDKLKSTFGEITFTTIKKGLHKCLIK
jgi:3-hydroxyisobutyrate dehydrogenase-like beta-hydroxyacid dehydrogenase